jgi:thiol-disulfide isomerase/thioredoxin
MSSSQNNAPLSETPVDVPSESLGEVPPSIPDETPTPDETPVPTETPTPASNPTVSFPYPFTATDLYGNTVTEQSFGDKSVFFVHFWGTWCPPCVSEMPDLAIVAQNYSDRVGFIALLDDYSNNISGAKTITENAGIPSSFIMVDAYTSGLEEVLELLSSGYVPTTVIIYKDNNGNWTSSDQLIGALGSGYANVLDAVLQ